MERPLKLVLCGAAGRMGRQIAELIRSDKRFLLVHGIDRTAPWISPKGAPSAFDDTDVVVDFSAAEASAAFAAHAAKARKPIVIGTTGFTPAQLGALKAASKKIALVYSPNMSPGMNLLFALARKAAAVLPDFDAVIYEAHHALKKDAPSGSAKRLAQALGKEAPMLSARAGDIVGDHTVLLAGPDERLELVHRAHARRVFARGALQAARWVAGRKPGLYSMADVLGIG